MIPDDERFSTSEEDRQKLARRKSLILSCALVAFASALTILALWLLVGCASPQHPESPLAAQIRGAYNAKMLRKTLGEMQRATAGIVFTSPPTPAKELDGHGK